MNPVEQSLLLVWDSTAERMNLNAEAFGGKLLSEVKEEHLDEVCPFRTV